MMASNEEGEGEGKNLRGEVSKFKSVYQNYFQDVIKEVKWKKMEDNFLWY